MLTATLAFDFFTVSLTATEIAEDFGEKPSAVTWGITITLMLRSVGAIISGSISDKYGRKWIMIFNLFCFIVLELGSGFTQNLPQLLGVRALYGIAMGVSIIERARQWDIAYECTGTSRPRCCYRS